MSKCLLCDKIFTSPSKLERHKNNKTPCNIIKEKYECKLCKISFDHKSRLNTHNTSKKHINIENQYNIDMSTNIETQNNIFNINQNITLINGFSETNIDIIELLDIERLLIYEDEIHKFIKEFTDYPDDIYGDSQYLILIFKFFIKIFAKLNFNLAYSENHNCNICSFNNSTNTVIEYYLLEIDNTQFNYNKKCIDYQLFIDKFLNLMNRVNNKFENNTLDYVYKYVIKYKKLLFTSENAKLQIENELLTSYDKFQKSKYIQKTEEEEMRIAILTARANAFKGIIRRIS